MTLPTSSSESVPSDAHDQPPTNARNKGERQQQRDVDLPLKLQIASAFATSGYFSRINVCLSATHARGLADVTDVDVLAIRHDIMFNQNALAVSCKSGASRSLSPAREIFYLRGVLDYVRAESGVVAFSQKPLARHLRDQGLRLNILGLSGGEIDQWCRSLTNGLPSPGYFQESAYEEYVACWRRVGNDGLAEYLRSDYWFHFDFRNLQNLIGHMRKLSSRLDGHEKWHTLIVLDVAVHLCLTVFDLCRQIRMLGLSAINETTSSYLFGGAVSSKARRDLYSKVQHLLTETGIVQASGPSLPPLDPAYTASLAELALRFIERPHSAILVPLVIQDSFWRQLGAKGFPARDDKNSLAAEKLAQDLIDFLKLATGAGWSPKI